LQSVLKQTYIHWECIIVNDGSPDSTEQIAKQWVAKDERFKYVYKKNGGLSSARNAGVNMAKGDYIQFLDADDILLETKFADSVNLIQGDAVVITNYLSFFDNSTATLPPFYKLMSSQFNFEFILNEWDITFAIPIHCGFFPSFLVKKNPFNETLKAKEDWLFWIQIAQSNIVFIFLDKPLALYRKHPNSMIKNGKLLLDNTFQFYNILDQYISKDEYKSFLIGRLKDKFNNINAIEIQKSNLKRSNTYQFGLFCKKIGSKFYFLPLARKIFGLILKFKAK
jgi:glycosyltransferase involved in cell wall biosynthesis